MRRAIAPRLAVLAGYVMAASAFTWPLPLHLGTHLTGDPGGDTGVYVWNQWVFRHEAVLGHNPLTTDQILSLTQRTDLSQHNYTAFLDLLAFPLMPLLGVVTTFNVIYLAMSVVTALATYALVRRATDADRLEAWLAGLVFAWSPVLVARSAGHFSLAAAAPLPAFLCCLITAERSRLLRHAAVAGLCVAWAAFCDAYYGVFCLMIVGLYSAVSMVRVTRSPVRVRLPWVWLLDVALVCLAGLVAGLLAGRGGDVDLMGVRVSVRGLYTPVFLLTLLSVARAVIAFRPRVVPGWGARPLPVRLMVVGILACVGPLAPVIYGLGERMAQGRFVSPPVLWRSSPHGVDLLALVTPNPDHPLMRWLAGDVRVDAPTIYAEYTASFSLIAVVVIGIAVWRAGYRPKMGWWLITLGFTALALGPFVLIDGFNTHVPGPWALLRYVPVVGFARMPTRFAVMGALGLAVLFAGALAAIRARWPARHHGVMAMVGVLLLAELLPAPMTLYSATISPIFDIVAADPRPVRLLGLPVGVRDGVSSAGNFSARSQFNQTRHGKRLIGGYLSRISNTRLAEMRQEHPTLDRLIALSEGRLPTPEDQEILLDRGPTFVENTQVGYVVINDDAIRPETSALVQRALGLREIARDGPLHLYVPGALDDPPQER